MNQRINWSGFLRKNLMAIFFFAAVILMFITTEKFRRFSNIVGIFNQISIYGIVAMGMTIAIINGEFDMSVGGIVSLSSLVSAWVLKYLSWGNPFLSITMGILVGLIFGVINGLLVVKTKINTFIVTLGTMVILYGLSATFCELLGVPSSITYNNEFMYRLGNGKLFNIPYFVWFFLLFVIITELTLQRTKFGRTVYAVGGNVEASRNAGLNIEKNKMIVFIICGFVSGLAGVMMSAKMMMGSPEYATDLSLTTISAVVLGGTNMAGGSGRAIRTLLGILVISLITNIFNLLNVSVYVQSLIKGAVIVTAVTANNFFVSQR
jgi:ribose transport system permease protein